jgi:hypothetical protein
MGQCREVGVEGDQCEARVSPVSDLPLMVGRRAWDYEREPTGEAVLG